MEDNIIVESYSKIRVVKDNWDKEVETICEITKGNIFTKEGYHVILGYEKIINNKTECNR